MAKRILCVNAGSSSLKTAVFLIDNSSEQKLFSGEVEDIGEKTGRLKLRGSDGRTILTTQAAFADHAEALEATLAALTDQGMREFEGVGHRIVHGGPDFFDPQEIDDRLRRRLKELIPFAPLHLPSEITMIEAVTRRWPHITQVACFDTAFHRGMPARARHFPVTRELWEQGVVRYGFHGLSFEFVVSALGEKLRPRAIIAHLGNGASIVALQNGRSIDTSMGLTPAGGFMMGTRTGDLDPGILLFLLRKGWNSDQLADLIEHRSGLAGVSGSSSDMKTLLAQRPVDANANEAIEMFCYQVRKWIGSYAAALGGLDALVFTGGIGERAAEIRAEICGGLEFLGIELDSISNGAHAEVISTTASDCVVSIVLTDEDLMIARHTRGLLPGSG